MVDEPTLPLNEELLFHVDSPNLAITVSPVASIGESIDTKDYKQIQNLLEEFSCLFTPADGKIPTTYQPFQVNTGDAAPISARPFRCLLTERETIERHVQEYLKRGWAVRGSSS